MSIDATYSTCLGRYINDAPERFSNCRPKTHIINGNPHLLFFSKVFIPNGTELRYDYGDPKNQNWRELKNYIQPFTMEEVRNSRYVGKKLEKKVILTAAKVLSAFVDKTPDNQLSINESQVSEKPSLPSENFNRIFDVKFVEKSQFSLPTQLPLLSTDIHFEIFSSNKNNQYNKIFHLIKFKMLKNTFFSIKDFVLTLFRISHC
ncbi:uncharacterized protein LOC136073551 [Hydra vulgaris]|uniref:uncharacterized protein LOC136073551 n=1 Tax=Hydra vulgaris TaxID=6087 RepID=UPI0032EA0B10